MTWNLVTWMIRRKWLKLMTRELQVTRRCGDGTSRCQQRDAGHRDDDENPGSLSVPGMTRQRRKDVASTEMAVSQKGERYQQRRTVPRWDLQNVTGRAGKENKEIKCYNFIKWWWWRWCCNDNNQKKNDMMICEIDEENYFRKWMNIINFEVKT